MLDTITAPDTATDPRETAAEAGLRYVSDARPGIRRRRAGRGFSYRRPDGSRVSDTATLARIRKLAVPPAWTQVWISPFGNGHIQATGRDPRGRKQYRYHGRFRELRERGKYERMIAFAQTLPTIRATVSAHMGRRGLPRQKVQASVVHLLETTLIRVGNDDDVRQNGSHGLTTLENRHVEVTGAQVRFRFKGKSGKVWSVGLRDRRVAKIIRACQELPGQELLQYIDDGGELRRILSDDVNAYLREITDADITAKDFRTWAGTVLATMALREVASFDSAAQAKRNVRSAIESVALRLGNTPTICRKCYVHPEILTSYLDGKLAERIAAGIEGELRDDLDKLGPGEAAVLALLRARLKAG
ncbi:DNA topoisomerase IB [Xanthobacteraceae bacterium Astr-EGSB]|uniref:DNA topoisomerase IB n=1 Tax=Astrobacterium formosum TaxID=3069710 RepID=UPI0027AE854A|nr:DNA topoisomerase IB [Xanthobacteraceae bacterium Astr-EGSB]